MMATDYSEVHGHLESGLVLTRYYLKKQEKLTFRVRLETRQLIWVRVLNQIRPEGAVDLRLVKEIRPGREVKEFDRTSASSSAVAYGVEDKKDKYCFSIHYGSTFRLKVLALQAPNAEEYFMWTEGLQDLCNSTRNASYSLQVERWLRKEFYDMKTRFDCINIKDLKAWLPKWNCKIDNYRLQECYQKVEPKLKDIGFDQFARIFRDLVFSPTIFRDHVEMYSEEKTVSNSFGERVGSIVSAEKFSNFLVDVQKEQHAKDLQAVRNIMADFVGDPMRSVRHAYFTPQEFEDYLFSPQNSVYDPKKMSAADHIMTRPLSHYWIASSHNTYLTGDQFKSESSTEAYLQALRMGSRCVELDCWDGSDGLPIIYHGHTLTSKIKFYDVVKTIKKYVWTFSEYPLILSIENHCSLPQQRLMASMFREVFGDDLLTDLVDRNGTVLPSPERLKRKIIIKYKKLPDQSGSLNSATQLTSAASMSSLFSRDEAADLNDLSQCAKTGIMYMQDSDDNIWYPHYFVLSNNKLCYTDKMASDGQDEADDSSVSLSPSDEASSNGQRMTDVPSPELHYSEAWFHGRLSGGRTAADRLLKQHSSLGDGAFLVRESETFVGDYTLSFWRQGKVNHCRIKSRQDGPNIKYFLVDNAIFGSLYELVTHYRKNPLRSESFWLVLTEAVPQPEEHVGMPWYNGSVSRDQAEDMLCRVPIDGAFLIRRSTGDELALSFRAYGKIKHCKIFREGRLFTIGSATFESLALLVQHYERNPLYRRVTLCKAVNEDVVATEGVEPEQCELYGTDIYHEPLTVRVRALYDFRSNKPSEELSFPQGAIITNVIKTDSDWWKGDYGGRRKLLFPAVYVEELPDEATTALADSDANRALGAMEKGAINISTDCSCITDGVIRGDIGRGSTALYRMRISTSELARPLEVAVTEDLERSDWMAKLKECAERSLLMGKGLKQAEQQMKIARELSDIIVYCRSVPYNPEVPGHFTEMVSLAEAKAEKACGKRDNRGKQFLQFNRNQISRIYPHGSRVNSSNFDPMPFWCCGSHMVALNYQTGDLGMQLNQGRFLQTGLCGYVLQPDCLKHPEYDPFEIRSLVGVDPVTISLKIVGARHLPKQGKGIVCPFVEVKIFGAYYDSDGNHYKTATKNSNGLNPVWDTEEVVEFDVSNPQLALIRFCVQDEDMFGEPDFLGQASLPVSCLRSGLRSVPLKNEYSEDLELASLLIDIDLFNPKEADESGIYSSVQYLRDRSLQLHEEYQLAPAEDRVRLERLRHELRAVENDIHAQHELRREKRFHK